MQELLRTGIYFCKLEVNLPIHPEELKEILQMQSSIDPKVAESVANCAKQIRSLPLKQQPSISELSEWAKYLSTLNSDELGEETLKASLCMIAKNKEDRQTMENAKLF